METFTRSQAAKLLGADPRQLEWWVVQEVLLPIEKSPGSGTPFHFTFAEVVRAAILLKIKESLGTGFMRPGPMARLFRTPDFDREVEKQRQEAERQESSRETQQRRIPHPQPEELVAHIYGGADGELEVEYMQHKDERVLSPSVVSIRVLVGLIVRSLVHRMKRERG